MQRSAVGNTNLGYVILQRHGMPNDRYWYWLGVGVLLAYTLFFNITVTAALAFLNRMFDTFDYIEDSELD